MKRLSVILFSIILVFVFSGEILAEKHEESSCINNGNGSVEKPYKICSAVDFEQMRIKPDGHYELGNHIDFSQYYNSDNEWLPIPSFSGTLNGKNHRISNLVSKQMGLFDVLEQSAVVHHLEFYHVQIMGYYKAGGIAGENNGLIHHVSVSGEVAGRWEIGGIVGINRGIIKHSDFQGTVSGEIDVGGIAGSNHEQGIIIHTHADVIANGAYYIGGLTGNNLGNIKHANVKSEIHGSVNSLGGIAGFNSGIVSHVKSTTNLYIYGIRPDFQYGLSFGKNEGSSIKNKADGNVIIVN